MVCWNLGIQFPRLVSFGLKLFKLDRTKWTWSPEAATYYKVSVLGMLTVMVVMAAAQIIYVHLVLQYRVGPELTQKINTMLDEQIGSMFTRDAQFIKQHFSQLTEVTKYYVDPVYNYFKILVDRAAVSERRGDFRVTFQIWFLEILLLFLLGFVMLTIMA